MSRAGWMEWVIATVVVAGVAGPVLAQDPVEVGPEIYTLLFENERVRVCEVRFAPGASIGMHSHPDHFVYVLESGTLQLSYPNGSTTELTATTGEVLWIAAETHAAVNTGTTDVRALVVELKENAAMAHQTP